MGILPYNGIRIIELSKTLSGRLAGLLFADQGAEVLIERTADFQADEHDEYFDRRRCRRANVMGSSVAYDKLYMNTIN